MQVLRAVLATVEVACFYWAVAYLPLADVMAYYLAGPIFVTAIAGTLLGEPVGWRRWSAVAVGLRRRGGLPAAGRRRRSPGRR